MMTWFQSFIMCQNSPLLLINSRIKKCTREESSGGMNNNMSRCDIPASVGGVDRGGSEMNRISRVQPVRSSAFKLGKTVDCRAELPRDRMSNNNNSSNLLVESNHSDERQLSSIVTLTDCHHLKTRREIHKSQQLPILQRFNTSQQTFFNNLARNRDRGCLKMQLSSSWLTQTMKLGLLALLALLALMSTSMLIGSVQGAQHFEVQPEPQYLVQNGHDARIRCLVRSRQGECLWLRNGRAIGSIAKKYQFSRQPEDGDCSLLIKNVSVQLDDGLWNCQVTASELEQDTLQSREVQLVVLVPPEQPQIKNISQNMQRLIVEEGKIRTVTCEIRGGNPAPQVEWFLDNKNITKEAQTSSFSAPNEGAQQLQQRVTQSRLRLADIKRTMNGKNLTCVAVHPTLNQSNSVELDVQYVPTVSVVQHEYSIVEGSPLSISCQVDANPPPNIVNWRLSNDAISAGPSRQRELVAANSASLALPNRPGPVLEFERISRDLNQNVFQCFAQNSYGVSLPADVKLNVLYAPFLLNTSLSESVPLGSEAQLACLFDGNPEPEVKWHYLDPLSRSAQPVQLANSDQRQQYLAIKNVTYRNEGDYHCEARNQINGVFYGVRSSNILLDVYGEPQFLVKQTQPAKAMQGVRSELALSFCSDPQPDKVYWQFGSIRLEVRLVGSSQTPPAGSKVNQRYVVHPLQPLQRRESSFSKVPSCFEAQLSILDPELSDQRDYTLVVQNERGHQSAVIRLRVSSPLSPVLMISSAFVTICGLFLCSLIIMFLVKKRHRSQNNLNGDHRNGLSPNNGLKNGRQTVEHLATKTNGAAGIMASAAAAAAQLVQQQQQQQHQHQQQPHTRNGLVSGAGNGKANGAGNPLSLNASLNQNGLDDPKGLLSMGSSSADSCSASDQKQLLNGSDRQSSGSGASTNGALVGGHFNSANSCSPVTSQASQGSSSSRTLATAVSTPSPLNHISVDDDSTETTYRAGDRAQLEAQLGQLGPSTASALIYANIDYTDHLQHSALNHHHLRLHQLEPHSPGDASLADHSISSILSAGALQEPPIGVQAQQSLQHQIQHQHHQQQQQQHQSPQQQRPFDSPSGIRSNVGATVALMNSLAAQANNQSPITSANSGVLNGAINQQLANSRQIRKTGPPKPPKPSIQQRNRFYPQNGTSNGNSQGLVMIGSSPSSMGQPPKAYLNSISFNGDLESPANELAAEYSRISFPARAEL